MKALILVLLLASLSVRAGDEKEDEGVTIAVKCGSLKGIGAILLIDKTGEVQTLPFSCPSRST